ncbi:hypothetical protein [Clostridioides difficile]|uniref:hypothetical protein n=1 Tax=Clostridioides difficile TaxID=1496 RepID=UPI000AE96277
MPSLFWGFRLTIWNVNLFFCYLLIQQLLCFRLTIWNGNTKLFKTNPAETLVLD